MLRRAAGRERKLVELHALAARHALGDQHEQRIEVERHGDVGRTPLVQIVCEPAGARAAHENPLRRRVAERRIENRERRFVLGIAPGPVSMNVGVVSGEPLIRRQARAHREMGAVIRGVVADLERSEQLAQALAVALERFG